MEEKALGEAGSKLVIEEFLHGEEASFHVFADGQRFSPWLLRRITNAASTDDTGPNTGGMGAYSIDAILSEAQHAAVIDDIIKPTLKAAQSYSGILYAGLMLTAQGPKLLEYNARFGDPETQVIVSRLKTDLLSVLIDIAEHRLASRALEWRPGAAATVVLVAGGYPGKIENGKQIFGLDEASTQSKDVKVYHAGTRREDGKRVHGRRPRLECNRSRNHAGRGFGAGVLRRGDDRIRRQRLQKRYWKERACEGKMKPIVGIIMGSDSDVDSHAGSRERS